MSQPKIVLSALKWVNDNVNYITEVNMETKFDKDNRPIYVDVYTFTIDRTSENKAKVDDSKRYNDNLSEYLNEQ